MIAAYVVNGELFFASSNELYVQSKYALDLPHGIVDMQASRLWDACAIAALGTIVDIYDQHGSEVEIIGLNEASTLTHERPVASWEQVIRTLPDCCPVLRREASPGS